MSTQAIVSLVGDNNFPLLKAVAGCNLQNAQTLADEIESRNWSAANLVYNLAREVNFGCPKCLVVVNAAHAVAMPDVLEADCTKVLCESFADLPLEGDQCELIVVKLGSALFDQPCYFGEDGEDMVVRGDIPIEEAAQRMNHLHEQCTEEKRFLKPVHLSVAKLYLVWNAAEDDFEWRLSYRGDIPGAVQALEVWVSSEGDGEEEE